jgi:hypothetical protein
MYLNVAINKQDKTQQMVECFEINIHRLKMQEMLCCLIKTMARNDIKF